MRQPRRRRERESQLRVATAIRCSPDSGRISRYVSVSLVNSTKVWRGPATDRGKSARKRPVLRQVWGKVVAFMSHAPRLPDSIATRIIPSCDRVSQQRGMTSPGRSFSGPEGIVVSP